MNVKEIVERFVGSVSGGNNRQIWKVHYGIMRPGEGGKDDYESSYDTIMVGTLDQVTRYIKTKIGSDGKLRTYGVSLIEDYIDLGGK